MSSVIFSGDRVKALKAGLSLAGNGTIWSGNIDPSSAGFTGSVGDIYASTSTGKLYENVDGTSFGWQYLIPSGEKGVANGVATLDGGGKVPSSQLASNLLNYKGLWSAATNTPTLANGVGSGGDTYICSAGGTVNFGAGGITFTIGDYVIYNGTIWQQVVNSNSVISVNGMSGAVILTTSDISEGSNQYFTNGRAQSAITGAASTITTSNLSTSKALASNGSGKVVASSTTDTELGYVSGVTGAIQTQLDAKQATLTIGNLTDAGTDGIIVTGGSGSVIGSGTSIAQHVADSSHNGYLSSTDWSTFNGKQPAGSYVTALTGDVTAAGPGSAASTLATVNSNVGSFTVSSITVNGKGLVTAASSGATGNLSDAGTDGIIVTNGAGAVLGSGTSIAQHVSDASHNGYLSSTDWSTFNGKQPAGSYITALTGDATAAGPGSSALTLATVNSNTGTFASVAVNGKGLVTSAAALTGDVTSSGSATTAAATQNNITSIPNLATVGTVTSGTWSATTVAVNKGGTGQTTKAPAFDALSPMTASGDLIYGGASGTGTALPKHTDGDVLTLVSGLPAWQAPTTSVEAGTFARNFLLNGGFDFWQAGAGTTATNSGGASHNLNSVSQVYLADQWYVSNTLGGGTINGVISYDQVNGVTDGSLYGARVKITTAPTGTGIQNGCELYQTLSALESRRLYNKTASFSVLVKGLNNVNQVGVQFFYYANGESKVDTAIGSEVLTTVNTSTFTACTISGQALGSSVGSGCYGVRIRITGVSSGNAYALNNGFTVEQAMLNIGATASTFSRMYPDPTVELAACQSFYEVINGEGGTPLIATGLVTTANTTGKFTIPFKVTKRSGVALAITVSSASHFTAANTSTSAAITGFTDLTSGSLNIAAFSVTLNGTYAANSGLLLSCNTSGRIIIDSRI